MQSIPIDYTVLDRFKFQYKPVGVKFTITKLDGIERLKKKKNICEMFVEAQTSNPFYIGKESIKIDFENCPASAPSLSGHKPLPKCRQKAPSFWDRLMPVRADQGASAFLTSLIQVKLFGKTVIILLILCDE